MEARHVTFGEEERGEWMRSAGRARRRARVRAAMLAATGAVCVAVAGCGGAGDSSGHGTAGATQARATNPNPTTPAGIQEREEIRAVQQEAIGQLATPARIAPSTVLARVMGKPIVFAAVSHQMAIDSSPAPVPDPPAYARCVARLRAQPAGASQASKAGAPPELREVKPGAGETQLREACETAYKHLLQSALSTTIHAQWLLGEAAEEGVRVSDAEVRHELALSKGSFHTEAEFDSYLAHSGQSLADMIGEIRLGKVVDGLSRKIEQRLRRPTGGEVAAYYDAHRRKYTIPEGRAVRILRTTTQASAWRAMQEIRAGKSFGSVVRGLSTIAQPIGASNGEVPDLTPGVYQEKSLNDAIFSAAPHELYGPVLVVARHRTIAPESGSGSFVFEVTRIVPARAIPLSTVRSAIATELARTEREWTLRSAVAAFKAKWRARTTCTAGYVVKNCMQYKASPRGEVGDPFTL